VAVILILAGVAAIIAGAVLDVAWQRERGRLAAAGRVAELSANGATCVASQSASLGGAFILCLGLLLLPGKRRP
jgi:hypothetical protein